MAVRHRVLAWLMAACVLFVSPVMAQVEDRSVLVDYDLDATSYTYCLHGNEQAGPASVQTSGSSTTVTAVTGTPFANLGVGDVMSWTINSLPSYRIVSAKASSISLTVNSAITLTGDAFRYRPLACGTGSGDGWFNTGDGYNVKTITIFIPQMDATGGVTASIECRNAGVQSQLETVNYAAATTNGDARRVDAACEQMRVGFKIVTADDGADTTTHAEKVNVVFSGERSSISGSLPDPVTVSHGGTGLTTATAYSPVFSGTTSTGPFQAALGPGTSGYVLTSNGAGVLPSWQVAASSSAFSAITAGTNTTAAMVVGSGASLAASGSGTITATSAANATLGTGYLSTTKTAGAAGTTANLLVKIDSTGNVVDLAASDTTGALGIAVSTKTSGQSVEVATRGIVNCVADNTTVIGNILVVGTSTGGRCRDSGLTVTSSVSPALQVIGKALTVATVGNAVSVQLYGPGHYGSAALPLAGGTLTGAVVVGNGATLSASGTGTVTATTSAAVVAGSSTVTFAGPTAPRIITVPDAAFTAARTDAANTFTGHQTIEGVTSTGATGTNLLVFGTSPTIVTPTIASFTNATHNHQDAAGGGTLSGAAFPPTVSAKTGATYTTTAADIAASVTITNTGNAGTLAITLMNDPTAGLTHRICEVDAQTITVAPSAGETMYFGGTTATLLTSGAVSACIVVTAVTGGSGAKWFASASGGPVS
jgi:hypothetical protein